MNFNIFVLYSPGLGGNHVANMLSTATGLTPRATIDEYIKHQSPNAHVNELINKNQINLKNSVYSYHIANFLWEYDTIKKFYQNRQILIIDLPEKTDTISFLRYNKEYKIFSDKYFYHEQKLLYSIDTIQKLTDETDFHMISPDLFFCDLIDDFLKFTKESMNLNLDEIICKQMHKIWMEKIKKSLGLPL